MTDSSLRIMIVGAHPDDADIKAGGTAAKWCKLGHDVRLVSVCDGAAGHHSEKGATLAARRHAEAEAAASVIGASFESLGEPDGELQPTLVGAAEGNSCHSDFPTRCGDYSPNYRLPSGPLLYGLVSARGGLLAYGAKHLPRSTPYVFEPSNSIFFGYIPIPVPV